MMLDVSWEVLKLFLNRYDRSTSGSTKHGRHIDDVETLTCMNLRWSPESEENPVFTHHFPCFTARHVQRWRRDLCRYPGRILTRSGD